MSDFSEILLEMSKIEKEYSSKMENVLKKFNSKLGKRYSLLSGKLQLETVEIPTTNSTLLKGVYSQFNEWINISNEHSKTSTLFQTKSDVFKIQLTKYEESRKKQIQFHQLISSNKDFQAQELDKYRQKYMDACDIVDASNQRLLKTDDKLQEKFRKALDEDRLKMFECKNNYLLHLTQHNSNVKYYYNNQVPVLMTHFETLNHRIIQFVQKQLMNLNTCQLEQMNAEVVFADKIGKELALVSINDTNFVADALKEVFALPADSVFKSTSIWLDTDAFDQQDFSITHLTNIYAKSQEKSSLLTSKNDQLHKEIAGLDVLMNAYKENEKLGDYEDVIEQKWQLMRDFEVNALNQLKCQVQMQIIQQQLQDKLVLGNNHSFKSTNFAIPTSCDYCKNNIWGKGMQCKLCQSSCHPKCEAKMGLNCSKEKKKKSKSSDNLPNSNSGNRKTMMLDESRLSISPRSDVSSTLIILQAIALYSYQATDESELTITEKEVLSVIQADDGNGWSEVLIEKTGKRGLVPANYIQISQAPTLTSNNSTSTLPIASIANNTKSRQQSISINYKCTFKIHVDQVKVLFDYDGDGTTELKIKVGDVINVTEEHDDGWNEGILGDKKGLFPSNYVERK